MLKKLTIKNFKAIQDMTIEFTPLTVLIGGNACGKSTVLQALDFLRSVATADFFFYLSQNNWIFSELKSQLGGNLDKPVEFSSDWEFIINDTIHNLKWDLSVDFEHDKSMWKIHEIIKDNDTEKIVYNNTQHKYRPESLQDYKVQSSSLKILNFNQEDACFYLQTFLDRSENFGVLSPERMRILNKNTSNKIRENGRTLTAFIHGLPPERKQELNTIASGLFGTKISIETSEAKDHMISLSISENFKKKTHIESAHISDGLLRIIAFAAIKMERLILRHGKSDGGIKIKADGKYSFKGWTEYECGFVLLDEIENGINPYSTDKVITILRDMMEKSGRQVIITTHSPIILNDIKPEEIVFLWKNSNGAVEGKTMFSTDEMKRTLKVLNPGEVWINYERDEIIERLAAKKEQGKTNK